MNKVTIHRLTRTLVVLFFMVLLLLVGLYSSGHQHMITALSRTWMIGHSTANINDVAMFKSRLIEAGETQAWPLHKNYNKAQLPTELTKHLQQYKSAAFLIVYNGQILTEHYFSHYDERSQTNSFSMAKAITTLLIGAAIEDDYIDSFDQPIIDFLPEFADDHYAKSATLRHLSDMTSGYDWNEEHDSILSPMVKLMYGNDVEQFVLSGLFNQEPGTTYYYSSASTQLLGIVLKRALQKANTGYSISQYLNHKLWKPLGMNDAGRWHLDKAGIELTYCCINTNARNFAKLGQLLLNQGQWQDKQLINSRFIQQMITPVIQPHYGHSVWLSTTHKPGFYWLSGHLGQYVISVPDRKLVIVRLGETWPSSTDFKTQEVPYLVKHAIKLVDNTTN